MNPQAPNQPQQYAPQQAVPSYPGTPAGQVPQPGVVQAGGAPGQPLSKPAIKTNPNSTQNTLQIAEIRDGVVIMNDGSFRSIIMAKSVNFDLMSPQEQEAVEFAYQG